MAIHYELVNMNGWLKQKLEFTSRIPYEMHTMQSEWYEYHFHVICKKYTMITSEDKGLNN